MRDKEQKTSLSDPEPHVSLDRKPSRRLESEVTWEDVTQRMPTLLLVSHFCSSLVDPPCTASYFLCLSFSPLQGES